MNRFLISCSVLLSLFCVGCGEGTRSAGTKEFIEVCNDHKILTNETCEALIRSIEDELTTRRANNSLDQATLDALSGLIKRLTVISKQSDVIATFANVSEPDQQLIGELLKSKWKENSK